MSSRAEPSSPSLGNLLWLFRPERTEIDVASRPSDGLVVFSVMWGMATMLSAASRYAVLKFEQGVLAGGLTWVALFTSVLLIMNPRKTVMLMLLSGIMIAQYLLRMPVSSNNQTIALFMNLAIFMSLAVQAWSARGAGLDREVPYEQLRVVARAVLAIMYFYGIFHKINTGFLDPAVSCATSLYQPLTRPFGLDDNIVGQYAAIMATFVIEGIAIACLYWKRFFWVGLLLSLPFHYVIPISGFSWYMDFSSLVFALYMLSVPREVASGLYSTGVWLVRRVPHFRAGTSAVLALAVTGCIAGLFVLAEVALLHPGRSYYLIWHSFWLLVWTAFGGVAMLLITRAAVLEVPYQTPVHHARQSWWVYALPTFLFISAASPYLGLKTETSIAMFSNLHTEGGVTNHLLFNKPPYLFDYQANVARVIETNDRELSVSARNPGFALVEHDIAMRLSGDPRMWITYEMNGTVHERVTAETFPGHRPNWLERKLLDFKPVDWDRPKICTH